MKWLTFLLLFATTGCSANHFLVVGSAAVESDQPEGKAVAKVEVRYAPNWMAAPRPGAFADQLASSLATPSQSLETLPPPVAPAVPSSPFALPASWQSEIPDWQPAPLQPPGGVLLSQAR